VTGVGSTWMASAVPSGAGWVYISIQVEAMGGSASPSASATQASDWRPVTVPSNTPTGIWTRPAGHEQVGGVLQTDGPNQGGGGESDLRAAAAVERRPFHAQVDRQRRHVEPVRGEPVADHGADEVGEWGLGIHHERARDPLAQDRPPDCHPASI